MERSTTTNSSKCPPTAPATPTTLHCIFVYLSVCPWVCILDQVFCILVLIQCTNSVLLLRLDIKRTPSIDELVDVWNWVICNLYTAWDQNVPQSSVAVNKYYLAVSGRSHSLGTFQHHTYQFWPMSSQYNQYSTFSHQMVDGNPLQKFLNQIYRVIFSQGKIFYKWHTCRIYPKAFSIDISETDIT